MHSRSNVFAENIVQALTSGKQNFLPGILLTDTDIRHIHAENIDFANHLQHKKGLSRLIERHTVIWMCLCPMT